MNNRHLNQNKFMEKITFEPPRNDLLGSNVDFEQMQSAAHDVEKHHYMYETGADEHQFTPNNEPIDNRIKSG